MSSDETITHWIEQLKSGETGASQPLWDRYFARLCRIARNKLPSNAMREFDEEDIALSAMDCLYRGMEDGRFQDLQDRNELWSLLILITSRKVSHRLRDRSAKKRGGGKVSFEFKDEDVQNVRQILSSDPSPDFIIEVNEQAAALMEMIPDEQIRKVAELRIAGHSNQEIAGLMGCGKRTVERRLMIVRQIWMKAKLDSEE